MHASFVLLVLSLFFGCAKNESQEFLKKYPKPPSYQVVKAFHRISHASHPTEFQKDEFLRALENHDLESFDRPLGKAEGDGHESHEVHETQLTHSNSGFNARRNPQSIYFKRDEAQEHCKDVHVNSVYESLLAKNILNDPALSAKIYEVYHKVLEEMRNEPRLHGSMEAWAKDPDYSRVLPVAQKYLISDKMDALLRGHNSALALDYLLYNSKQLDGIGMGDLRDERDYVFSEKVVRARGKREEQFSGINRTQYGIVDFDLPELEVPNAKPWLHWGRDKCFVDPTSSPFNRNVSRMNIPLVCGVSGTTTLAIWPVLKTKVALNESEMFLFALSVWTGLCADGGHSLQEVLSSFKFSASYLSDKIKDHEFKEKLSDVTVQSIIKMTEGMSATGDPDDPGLFGRYYDSFFSKIHDADLHRLREKSEHELLTYLEHNCI